jgi:hypothetical protein
LTTLEIKDFFKSPDAIKQVNIIIIDWSIVYYNDKIFI